MVTTTPLTTTPEKLFSPTTLGNLHLQHRIVLAPLTRFKSSKTNVPNVSLMKEYYSQRSKIPGTLVIAEGTYIDARARGFPGNAPGIYSPEQVAAWSEIVKAVHANNSHIFLQLFAQGRAVFPSALKSDNLTPVGPSAIPLSDTPSIIPHALTTPEIHEYTQLFVRAARNAMDAGFDGVEVHVANGYLLDQFLQDTANNRVDEYGGSVENRSRFPLEVVTAVVNAVGAERVGVRLSPWSPFQDMRMSDPIPQFTHFVTSLRDTHPTLAYLHIIEPRITGASDSVGEVSEEESNDFIRALWPGRIISAGGFTRDTAIAQAEKGDLIAFGRLFIANPDLPRRLAENKPLNKYDRSTFSVPGNEESAVGYIDYPALEVSPHFDALKLS